VKTFAFHAFTVSTKLKSQLTQVAWASLGYALLFLVVGFLILEEEQYPNNNVNIFNYNQDKR